MLAETCMTPTAWSDSNTRHRPPNRQRHSDRRKDNASHKRNSHRCSRSRSRSNDRDGQGLERFSTDASELNASRRGRLSRCLPSTECRRILAVSLVPEEEGSRECERACGVIPPFFILLFYWFFLFFFTIVSPLWHDNGRSDWDIKPEAMAVAVVEWRPVTRGVFAGRLRRLPFLGLWIYCLLWESMLGIKPGAMIFYSLDGYG